MVINFSSGRKRDCPSQGLASFQHHSPRDSGIFQPTESSPALLWGCGPHRPSELDGSNLPPVYGRDCHVTLKSAPRSVVTLSRKTSPGQFPKSRLLQPRPGSCVETDGVTQLFLHRLHFSDDAATCELPRGLSLARETHEVPHLAVTASVPFWRHASCSPEWGPYCLEDTRGVRWENQLSPLPRRGVRRGPGL